jgi:hypothetical protein
MRTSLTAAASRLAMLAGHYYLQVNAAVMLFMGASISLVGLGVLPRAATVPLLLASYIPMVYSGASAGYHQRNQLFCSRHLADTPDDPAAAVAAKDRQLRAFHWYMLNMRRCSVFVLAVLAVLLVAVYFGAPRGTGSVGCLALFSLLTVGSMISSTHNRLGPWCPYCRHRGGRGKDPQPIVPTDPRSEVKV